MTRNLNVLHLHKVSGPVNRYTERREGVDIVTHEDRAADVGRVRVPPIHLAILIVVERRVVDLTVLGES